MAIHITRYEGIVEWWFVRLLLASLALLLGAGSALASDPGSPTPVSATTYSATAVEIFWQRASGGAAIVGYEVARDGAAFGVFDALSYFDPNLVPDSIYRYSVTSIDASGTRSDTVDITVSTAAAAIGLTVGSEYGPPAPTGLMAIIYSNTAAEIFWDRRVTPGLSYEITIDSTLATSSTGTSYFTETLLPGSVYRMSVAAIDSEGQRSPGVSITVDTIGTTYPRTINGIGGGAPSAPWAARLSVYSDTAAELFWGRPSAAERVVATEVARDGIVLDLTVGTSYFDATREAGRAYIYVLTAIADSGARSATTIVSTDTILPADDGELSATWLVGTNEIVKRNAHARWYPALLEYYALGESAGVRPTDTPAPPSGITLLSTNTVSRDGNSMVSQLIYSCDAGGIFEFYSFPRRFNRGEMQFNDCQLPDFRVNGALHRTGWDAGGYDVHYESLVIGVDADEYWINGLAQRRVGRSLSFITDTIGPLDYTFHEDGREIRITGLQQTVSDNLRLSPRTRFTTEFQVLAPWTAGRPVNVFTPVEFEDADDGVYSIGQLLLENIGDGGNAVLRLDASTGIRATFQTSLFRDGAFSYSTWTWGSLISLPCMSVTVDEQAIDGCELRP